MKHLLLSLFLVTICSLHAIDNNVELVANKDFSVPTLFANQPALAVTDTPGKWFAGNIAQFTTSIANGAFESTSVTGGIFYDYYLGQITTETLNTGRYHISLRAKGTAPFFLKISGTNALGAEWTSSLKNNSITIEKTLDYSGYSIKFTPTADWTTLESDMDLFITTNSSARLYFVFPSAASSSVAVDDVSFMRTKDIVVFNTYYVRPEGDNTSWKNISGLDPEQIITSNSPTINGTSTYYFAKGNYTKAGIVMTTGKIYGGFIGDETSINLSARALSDKDGNGIVEPWEFTNETIINGTNPITGVVSGSRMVTVTGGEINGLTIQDHFYNASGVITLGYVSSAPNATHDIETNAGKMINCTVRKLKINVTGGGPVMLTNKLSLVDGCLIEECVATGGSSAGAVYMPLLGGKVANSVLRNNIASFTGTYAGAIRATALASTDMNAIVENCVIYNNTSAGGGGAIRSEAQASKRGLQVINCTVVNNKSTNSITSSVDLINGGIVVNCIVVDDPFFEIRSNTINNYVSNCAVGELMTPTTNFYPNTDVVIDKTANDFAFLKTSTFAGSMMPGDAGFDQAKYDEIRSANFKVTETYSAAITTASLKTLPANYQIAGSGATIDITATIPTKDIVGTNRPITDATKEVTLGAYQFSTATGFNTNFSNGISFYGSDESVVVLGAQGNTANLYSVSGQLIKQQKLISNKSNIAVGKGFYIVTVGNVKSKVLVK